MLFLVHQTEALEVIANVRHISARSIMGLTIAVYKSFFVLAGSRELSANSPYNARYAAVALHMARAIWSLKSSIEWCHKYICHTNQTKYKTKPETIKRGWNKNREQKHNGFNRYKMYVAFYFRAACHAQLECRADRIKY